MTVRELDNIEKEIGEYNRSAYKSHASGSECGFFLSLWVNGVRLRAPPANRATDSENHGGEALISAFALFVLHPPSHALCLGLITGGSSAPFLGVDTVTCVSGRLPRQRALRLLS